VKDENTCIVDGVEYVAVAADDPNCNKCAGKEAGSDMCQKLGFCTYCSRSDEKFINWIKKDDK
jgi:hypothetical protein